MRDKLAIGFDKIVELSSYPGKYLYHYTKSDTALNYILASNKIRFSCLANTNDPEESTRFELINLDETKYKIGENSILELMSVKKELPYKFLSVSFSMDKPWAKSVNTLNYFNIKDHCDRGYLFPRMWATYGEGHKGICLCFNKKKIEAVFKKHGIYGEKINYISGNADKFHQDIYSESESTPFLIPANIESINNIIKHIKNHSKVFFFTKQDDWRDECEFRYIYIRNDGNQRCVDIDFEDALEAIIIGARFEIEKYKEIQKVCKERKIDCFRVRIYPGSSHIFPVI